MFAAVLSGFLVSIAAPLLFRVFPKTAGWLLSLCPLGLFIYFSFFVVRISAGETVRTSAPWIPDLGVGLSFRLDGLSLVFALIISGIGFLVTSYSIAYFTKEPRIGSFYSYILAFMASMLGVVLADNLIAFFVFWELTSVASYLLIGFDHEKESARKAAWQALLVTDSGGYALLLGILLLWRVGGTFELSELFNRSDVIRTDSLYYPIFALVLFGALSKSAQFPFHFWLPNAMEAPTPVSTYLHSATMVKAGVYFLARLSPLMGNTVIWHGGIITAGALTMLLGGVLALKEFDLKRVLAYSTVSILGVLVFLIGIGTRMAVVAAITYLLVHAFYKAALFLIVGVIDHEAGTRDVRRLGGLWKQMPITAIAGGLAALSMAGFPPLFGFIGKEKLYSTTLEAPIVPILLTAVAFVMSLLLVVAAGITILKPFFSREKHPGKLHDGPFIMVAGPLLLAGLGLLFGLAPGIAEALISSAAGVIASQEVHVEFKTIPSPDKKLLLSVFTIAAGAVLYFCRTAVRRSVVRLDFGHILGPSRAYEFGHAGLNWIAGMQTRFLQSGHLHYYLLIIICATVALAGFPLVRQLELIRFTGWLDIRLHELLIGLIIISATFAVLAIKSRFSSVVALGAVGYGVGLIYLMFGAPDLAITQFAVDTLTVVLLVLVLYPMPRFEKFSRLKERVRDAFGAAAAGLLMTGLTLRATAVSGGSFLSPFFAERSYSEANGRNIVNIILVDFRALDTVGEITVLAIAAVGVYSLLKLRIEKN
ncbi:MAG: putative monovalent cation/H+ antiporter subunit A [Candidatus Abyssobacteria bacterium SURF_5]|uniref:Putative monovalent cation/H+ antiporter subunit A n=1 Tax=Abyssobacteria bacterium (strain SURF_5) TaxID=2093360 RepID=A0A3A4NUH3_ABYX5|nr:MAG: putative monovalent cation/H+ antiporter subunit A [Candidatus Abyssubacteria bacterium SURF_5]